MISDYHFEQITISQIKIGTRLRKDLGDIESLAQSMDRLGLLQPIVITQDMWLVAGERRLTAAKHLGWKQIPAMILASDYSGVTS